MPSTPTLKLRKNIWTHFPVLVDAQGRGANGAERHCVEWHNTKVRQMAKEAGKTEAEMRAELLPRLLRALSASKAWTVEAPAPGSKCVAVLAMRFAAAAAAPNKTRKSPTPPPKANNKQVTRKSRWANLPRSVHSTNKPGNKPVSANATRKAPKNHSGLAGEAMVRKARGILNLMSAATVDRLSHEFASLSPKTVGDSEALLAVVAEIALDQQAYHPLVIHLLHVLDARHAAHPYHEKPSKVVVDRIFARAMEEPLFAKMEATAEESNSPVPRNFDDRVALQKRFFRSVMLFSGFLYRDGFATWTSYKSLLRHFASMALETDPADLDYRVFDGYAQGLMYTLIRGGARMVADGGEASATFGALLAGIRRLATEAKRGFVRSDAAEFVAAAEDGFRIKAGMTWTVGAPVSDVKAAAAVATAVKKASPAGLGSDIAELWRRFPLDVKQDGAVWVVRFHNKKLRERFEKETGFKSVGDLEAALSRQILGLIDASAHWKRGPVIPGTFVTVVKK